MKWIETIELRSASLSNIKNTINTESLLEGISDERRPYKVVVMEHVSIVTDICFHLLFETEEILLHGSEPGLRLVAQLKEKGLVNHKIWMETSTVNIDFED